MVSTRLDIDMQAPSAGWGRQQSSVATSQPLNLHVWVRISALPLNKLCLIFPICKPSLMAVLWLTVFLLKLSELIFFKAPEYLVLCKYWLNKNKSIVSLLFTCQCWGSTMCQALLSARWKWAEWNIAPTINWRWQRNINIHSIIIHKRQKLETTQMAVYR